MNKTIDSVKPINGDAGFRQYYRLACDGKSLLAVYAPPATEKNTEFVQLANMLCSAGVIAPEVYSVDYDQGFLLISDLGNQLLFDLLNEDTVRPLYKRCLDTVVLMQSIERSSVPAGDYDKAALLTELNLFPQWFVETLLGHQLSQQENKLLESLNSVLLDSAVSQPQGFVHRDFHCRNILVENDDIAVIDFQDGLWGPISYDVVSLLKDCYIRWPEEVVNDCLHYYHDNMPFDTKPSFATFRQQFDFMGLQRHIKVLGIFARLSLRDNKHGYLKDLPLVVGYVRETAQRYEQTRDFVDWFDEALNPLIAKQSWSHS